MTTETWEEVVVKSPQQSGWDDCGVFTMVNAVYLLNDLNPSFDTNDISRFRRVIALYLSQIVTKKAVTRKG